MRKLAAVTVSSLVLLLASAPTAGATPTVDGHFPISGFDTNSKIAAGPDGNMWMAIAGAGKDVARISPTGKVDEFELGGVSVPSGIAAGPDGDMWITQAGGVASFSPSDPVGTVKTTALAEVKANSPIVADPDGEMWVATENAVLHFSPASPGEAKSVEVAGLAPKDIDVAGSSLVIADQGNKRIVILSTAGAVTEVPLLGTTTTAQGVAGSPSGQIAFSKSDGNEGLALVTPPALPTPFEMPGDPFGVARGSDEAFWFAMSADDSLRRVTPDGKVSSLTGFPPKFFPRQIAAGPNNTLWVTMEIPGENVYEVARVTGLEPPVKPPEAKAPDTKIVKGPKGKVKTRKAKASVKFSFSSSTAGAKFECALVKLKKGKKKAPRPKFGSCTSPKKLKLKPGRYRFSVRAVAGGLADPTPATKSFSVIRVRLHSHGVG